MSSGSSAPPLVALLHSFPLKNSFVDEDNPADAEPSEVEREVEQLLVKAALEASNNQVSHKYSTGFASTSV
jgi:hypothetical protein